MQAGSTRFNTLIDRQSPNRFVRFQRNEANGPMHAEALGLRRAGFKIAILAGSYLLLVFLIVTFEVASGAAPFLRWAYLASSLAYTIGVIGICFVDIANKLVALFIAVPAILAGLFFGLVAGVSFKFLIGGTI